MPSKSKRRREVHPALSAALVEALDLAAERILAAPAEQRAELFRGVLREFRRVADQRLGKAVREGGRASSMTPQRQEEKKKKREAASAAWAIDPNRKIRGLADELHCDRRWIDDLKPRS